MNKQNNKHMITHFIKGDLVKYRNSNYNGHVGLGIVVEIYRTRIFIEGDDGVRVYWTKLKVESSEIRWHLELVNRKGTK